MKQLAATWFPRLWLITLTVWTIGLVSPGAWFGQMATTKVGEFTAGKVLHISVYALLAASAGWLPTSRFWRFLIAVPLLSAHGALTEVIQLWVPDRTGCVFDWVIDSTGVLMGWLAMQWRWPADNAGDKG